ncbi:MAG: polyhydroxyalkanoic acid system family protein [Proteobacteria bacterium]|nr:polyhydroxyalkanoic acid system family protein [Pseudomonadota bacterium]MDE2411012.1 polyhydroxyalkanoic acid system family protein [Sphingomonadales bacterium]
MRVPISHGLTNDEVRRRLKSRTGEIADFIPGGVADVSTDWPDENTMNLTIGAMGKSVTGKVELEQGQVVFTVELPGSLSFVEPMIRGALEQKGRKLLA